MDKDDKIAKTTQKVLNKVISEEILATALYEGSLGNVKPDEMFLIEEKFSEIAKDERDDHLASLVKYATVNGYEVPFKSSEVNKHAAKKLVSLVNGVKSKQDAVYYIEKAIKSEEDAVESYEDVLSEEVADDLKPLLLKLYYEELQHLDELDLVLKCALLGVKMS